MESHALSKFFAAPAAGGELQKLQAEITHKYSELSLEAMIVVLNRSSEVLDRLPVFSPPSQGRSPQAVGVEKAIDIVTNLVDVKGPSVKVVVIYGQGGIGKTTLATAVFNKLDLKNYKYCKVDTQQNCSEADLKLLQEHIVRDVYDRNVQLRSLSEGQQQLAKDFKELSSQQIFVFIDNALKQGDLEKVLPVADLASLPPQSRILLTTRNLNETLVEGGIKHSAEDKEKKGDLSLWTVPARSKSSRLNEEMFKSSELGGNRNSKWRMQSSFLKSKNAPPGEHQ